MVSCTFFQLFPSNFSVCEMCEMTSFSMTSPKVDLNEAAKDVDMALTLLVSLLRTCTKYETTTTFGLHYEIILRINDSGSRPSIDN